MELKSVDDLKGCPRNPRKISGEALAGLKVSLAMYGDIAWIVWNRRTGELVAGHQRVRALRALYGEGLSIEGEELVAPTGERWPVRVVEWDEPTALGALVTANNPAICGEFDDGLQQILAELERADSEVFHGLCLDELVADAARQVAGAEVEEESIAAPAVVKRGELWALNEHRLLCGDALRAEDCARLMGGANAAMAFTDPPYNVAYQGAAGRIMNDDLGTSFGPFLEQAMRNLLRHTAGAVYVCMSSSELDVLQRAFRAAGGHWSTFLIWAKDAFTLGRSDYQRQYEPILYGWREGATRHWCGDRDQGDLWEFDRPRNSTLHPTMKPVELVCRALRNSSQVADTVLDLFGGSGTTLLACEISGRVARVMEIDPVFCDVIVARWQKQTGCTARLLESGRPTSEV